MKAGLHDRMFDNYNLDNTHTVHYYKNSSFPILICKPLSNTDSLFNISYPKLVVTSIQIMSYDLCY